MNYYYVRLEDKTEIHTGRLKVIWSAKKLGFICVLSPLQVAPAIKEKMMKKGSVMLGYQPHRGKVNFFRQVVISPQVSREDMDFLLDEIDSLGRDM